MGGECLWQAEAKALHAGLVFLDHVLAVGLRVGSVGEEHALVAGGLFILADAAWLLHYVSLGIGGVVGRRGVPLLLRRLRPEA